MTPSTSLQFTKNDTRVSALAKAGVWYDRIVDQQITDVALAVGNDAAVPSDQKIAALDICAAACGRWA